MQELLVLGIIPGTNIQITFLAFVYVMTFVSTIALAIYLAQSWLLRELALTLMVMYNLRRPQDIV